MALRSVNWSIRSIAWIAFALISMNIGLGKSEPWASIPLAHAWWATAWCASFIALFTSWGDRIGGIFLEAIDTRYGRAAVVGWIAALTLLSWKKFGPLGYEFPIVHLALCAAALPFLRRTWLPFFLNLALLIASIHHFPLEYHRSDMLKAIGMSLDNWARREPIYVYHALDWGSIPTYFPLVFVSHLPAWAAGIDLRWNTVFWRAIWFVPLYYRVYARPRTAIPAWASSLLFVLLLNPYWAFRHELYFEFYLALIVGSWLVPRVGDGLLGIAIWARNFVVLFLPFLIVRRFRDRAWAQMGALVTGILVGAAAVYAFFLPGDWAGWWHAKDYFVTLLSKPEFQGDYGLTIAPFLFKLGIQKYSMLLQFAGGAALGAVALKNRRIPEVILAAAGITWFLGLNVMFWNYFLVSQILWIGIGAIIRPDLFQDVPKTP